MRHLIMPLLLFALTAWLPIHAGETPAENHQPEVRIDDVQRFYQLYDRTHGKPTVEQLQSAYLDKGSTGLRQFVQSRIGNAGKLAAAMAKSPRVYSAAKECAKTLPAVRQRLSDVLPRLATLYPPATFPPVTVVIGRNNTGGTTTASGVIIGLETICRANWMNPDITVRLVHLIAHEYIHVQQPAAQADPPPGASLLFQSLVEGGAEFVGELISGQVANVQLQRWTRGHECGIERRFQAQADGADTSSWLYNGAGTSDKPGDLGYWVGYRIAKAYYAQAHDKRQAIADIISIDNGTADVFLRKSGWKPATGCPGQP